MNKSIIDFLQNKKGVVLYDKLRGTSVIFRCINYNFDTIICTLNGQSLTYSKYGGYSNLYPNGEQILVPSKEMQDWHKFAWKKGDILYNELNNEYRIFNKFLNNNYLSFNSKYLVDGYTNMVIVNCDSDENTAYYEKVSDEKAKEIIAVLERYYGGKLNLETLHIDKFQFKDGDVVYSPSAENKNASIFIFREFNNDRAFHYAALVYKRCNLTQLYINVDSLGFMKGKDIINNLRLATYSEKQQLFKALAKENKAWDAKKKAIVNLPKKCEFKPKDWCLMKYKGHYNNRGWELCQYAYTEHRVSSCGESRDFYHSVGGAIYAECIPYTDQTAHLLGTTDGYAEGGEEREQ